MAAPQPIFFGDLLKYYRIEAGMTQEQLAERARISVRGISDLERGINRSPRRDTAERLAEALQLAAAHREHLLTAAARRSPSAEASNSRGVIAAPTISGSPVPFVGRARELAQVRDLLAGKGPALLLLTGEPGIGKSRLLDEAARLAREQDWAVLRGGCHRRGGEYFAPVLGALQSRLRGASPSQARMDLRGCGWLARLLPELSEAGVAPAPAWELPVEQEQRLVFDAVARFLANVAGPSGTLLVLDDLQWAGNDVLHLLASLIRSHPDVPLRTLCAYRDTEVRSDDPLAVFLGDLAPSGFITRIQLHALAHDEATHLLRQLLLHELADDATLVSRVVERADGVPFFLVSCAQAMRVGVLDGHGVDDVPWGIQQSIRQRVAPCSAEAQTLLRIAAVAGREVLQGLLFDVASHLGIARPAVLLALSVLREGRLLLDRGETLKCPHDLIRQVVIADMGGATRRALHAAIASALEAQAQPVVEELAYHYAQADLHEQAAIYLERAGDRAVALHAYAEAAEHYGAAAEHLHAMTDDAATVAIREKRGKALMMAGRLREAAVALTTTSADYRLAGDLNGMGRAIALVAQIEGYRGEAEQGIRRLREVTEAAQTGKIAPETLGIVYNALALLCYFAGHYTDGLAASEEATALALQVGDTRLHGQAEMHRAGALLTLGRHQEVIEALEPVIPLLEARDDLWHLTFVLNTVAYTREKQGQFTDCAALLARAVSAAERLGDPVALGLALVRRASLAFRSGAWRRAQDDLERALALTGDMSMQFAVVYARIGLGALDVALGRVDHAREQLDAVAMLAQQTGDFQALRMAQASQAELDLVQGRPREARLRLEPLLDRHDERESDVTMLLWLLGWAYLDEGADDDAQRVIDEGLARATLEGFYTVIPNTLRIRALLQLRHGDWNGAEASLEEASARAAQIGLPYAQAKLQYTQGVLHAAKGEPEQVRDRYERALATCARLGERLYAEQITRALALVD